MQEARSANREGVQQDTTREVSMGNRHGGWRLQVYRARWRLNSNLTSFQSRRCLVAFLVHLQDFVALYRAGWALLISIILDAFSCSRRLELRIFFRFHFVHHVIHSSLEVVRVFINISIKFLPQHCSSIVQFGSLAHFCLCNIISSLSLWRASISHVF